MVKQRLIDNSRGFGRIAALRVLACGAVALADWPNH
jgi:hypothetical protein